MASSECIRVRCLQQPAVSEIVILHQSGITHSVLQTPFPALPVDRVDTVDVCRKWHSVWGGFHQRRPLNISYLISEIHNLRALRIQFAPELSFRISVRQPRQRCCFTTNGYNTSAQRRYFPQQWCVLWNARQCFSDKLEWSQRRRHARIESEDSTWLDCCWIVNTPVRYNKILTWHVRMSQLEVLHLYAGGMTAEECCFSVTSRSLIIACQDISLAKHLNVFYPHPPTCSSNGGLTCYCADIFWAVIWEELID